MGYETDEKVFCIFKIDFWFHEKAFDNLKNDRERVLFSVRMMLYCLERIHPFEESILKYFLREGQRKHSHFHGIRSWLFQKWTVQKAFSSDEERFWTEKKPSYKNVERQRMRSFRCITHSCRSWTHSPNYRTRSSWER